MPLEQLAQPLSPIALETLHKFFSSFDLWDVRHAYSKYVGGYKKHSLRFISIHSLEK